MKHTPNFRSRHVYIEDQLPPVRAYFHNGGFEDAFSNPNNNPVESEARDHLLSTLRGNLDLIQDADYLLAALWGNSGAKTIDLFSYSDTRNWPGNPDVKSFILENGIYQPDRRDITCGDTLIVLGAEESFRRTTKSLDEYMTNLPKIEGAFGKLKLS